MLSAFNAHSVILIGDVIVHHSVILIGDFIVHHKEWLGSRVTESAGKATLEMCNTLV